jgi:hypothetical protein
MLNKHITRAALDATGTPAQIAAARDAEAKFSHVTHCMRCARFLSAEVIWRRMYSLPGVRALIVLCDRCNSEAPVDSAADLELQADIKRLALPNASPGGRA